MVIQQLYQLESKFEDLQVCSINEGTPGEIVKMLEHGLVEICCARD